jgi:hypothetical protein
LGARPDPSQRAPRRRDGRRSRPGAASRSFRRVGDTTTSGSAASAPPHDLDAGTPAQVDLATDSERARSLEQAAADIVARWGREPTDEQIAEIRAELGSIVPGWYVLSQSALAPLRGFLRSAGMASTTIDAVLGR